MVTILKEIEKNVESALKIMPRTRAECKTQSPELIYGVLRRGHICNFAAPSKAGKSFALINLGLSIASGSSFLGHNTAKSKVIHLDMEVEEASLQNRVFDVMDKRGLIYEDIAQNHRYIAGHGMTPNLIWGLLEQMINQFSPAAVILDPHYKLSTGEENSSTEMSF